MLEICADTHKKFFSNYNQWSFEIFNLVEIETGLRGTFSISVGYQSAQEQP